MSCFSYSIVAGKLFWRVRPVEHFKDQRACNAWNTRYANKQAFTAISDVGYFHGRLDDKGFLAHRLIWKWVTGEDPPPLIDHEDTIRLNNSWGNLRAATKGQNNVNSKRGAGVWFDKERGKWAAYTKLNGKKIHLGRHDTEEQARAARNAGAIKYHGEFARCD
jgi:hypothetical protein